MILLLPYLGHGGDLDVLANDPQTAKLFFCPSSPNQPVDSWINFGVRAAAYAQYFGQGAYPQSRWRLSDKDSVTAPLLMQDMVMQTQSGSDYQNAWVNHVKGSAVAGANCLYADGHVVWEDGHAVQLPLYDSSPGVSDYAVTITLLGNQYSFRIRP
jgi:prepilin-type processing-associated H-X9-DG protein